MSDENKPGAEPVSEEKPAVSVEAAEPQAPPAEETRQPQPAAPREPAEGGRPPRREGPGARAEGGPERGGYDRRRPGGDDSGRRDRDDSRSGPPRGRGRDGRRGYRSFYRRKVCKFCAKRATIDYKDADALRRFITDRGKILPRRITGTCPKHQRLLSKAIKQARVLALLPFVEK